MTPRFSCAFASLLCAVVGCNIDEPPRAQTSHPSAGLYTPGSDLGASDPTDTPTPGAGLGDRCVSLGNPPDLVATTGSLTLTYTTRTLEGRYAPKNCTAAWIETADGRYVATIEIRAGLRRPGLVYWQDHACTEKTGPDVVATATLADHEKAHMALWNGMDLDGLLVPDGSYVLFIEVTESDKEPGEITSFEFVKGPERMAGEQSVDALGPLVQVTMDWSPDSAGGAAGGSP